MRYNGLIKQSRTLDALAFFAILEAMLATLQNEIATLGFTPAWQSILRIAVIGALGWLRFQTTGPVGNK